MLSHKNKGLLFGFSLPLHGQMATLWSPGDPSHTHGLRGRGKASQRHAARPCSGRSSTLGHGVTLL